MSCMVLFYYYFAMCDFQVLEFLTYSSNLVMVAIT